MNRRKNCLKRKTIVWLGFLIDTKFKDKEEKRATRDEMVKLIDQMYSADFLEKHFHTLRTAFIWKHTKIAAGQDPNKKKWKFYKKLKFLKEEIDKPKKPQFNVDERELLIDFFKSHSSLWNHNADDCCHWNVHYSLLEKLVWCKFDNKFKKEDTKQELHSLEVIYKRGKAREEESKTSGSGCSEIYYSTWEHLKQMEFLDDAANVEKSYTLLDSEPYVPHQKKRRRKNKEERNAKMQLWKSLTKSLTSKMLEEYASVRKSDYVLAEKANLFGTVFAVTLLQYEIKGWVYLKKKILDVFFDYDQQKQGGYGPTLMVAGPSCNSSSRLFLASQEALVKIITLICYLQTISSVINRWAQQLTKCFNHFYHNQLTHRILR